MKTLDPRDYEPETKSIRVDCHVCAGSGGGYGANKCDTCNGSGNDSIECNGDCASCSFTGWCEEPACDKYNAENEV